MKMDKYERHDILKFAEPYIASELRKLPYDPIVDPPALQRIRELTAYHSGLLSVREGIKYVYVRDVLRHANGHVVKLNKTTPARLSLNKTIWIDFLRDPQTNGTGPFLRKELEEQQLPIDEFVDGMVWVYNFTYEWADVYSRIPRNESVKAKNVAGWPFTRRHLDFINIFRASLDQHPLKMIWLDVAKDLVLPQIVIVDPLIAGTKESWENLGLC